MPSSDDRRLDREDGHADPLEVVLRDRSVAAARTVIEHDQRLELAPHGRELRQRVRQLRCWKRVHDPQLAVLVHERDDEPAQLLREVQPEDVARILLAVARRRGRLLDRAVEVVEEDGIELLSCLLRGIFVRRRSIRSFARAGAVGRAEPEGGVRRRWSGASHPDHLRTLTDTLSPVITDVATLLTDRLRPLYERVNAKAPVVLQPSADPVCWGQQLKDGHCVILTNEARDTESAFGHELLHGEDELAGYVIPPFIDGHESGGEVESVLAFGHNALAHHRIFPRFVALGLPSGRFLNERDKKQIQRVYGDVAKLKAAGETGLTGAVVSLPFMALGSPGDTEVRTPRMRDVLRAVADTQLWDLLSGLVASATAEQNPANWKYWLGAYCALSGYRLVAFETTGPHGQVVSGNLVLTLVDGQLRVEDPPNGVHVAPSH